MEPLHVALDLDDVVLDFVGGVCETVTRDFKVKVTREDITNWNFGQFIDDIIGRPWFEWLEDHAWLWGQKFKPVEGALGGIEKLRRAGHYVEIVTAKPEWAEDATWDWLAKYKPRVHRLTIVPLNGGKKTELTDADVLVDDKWENCLEWVKDGRPSLLFSQPHNASYGDATPDGMTRVKDWLSVLDVFDLPYLDWPEKRLT
jgi:5'(3')-deoxyribonucleotidase